MKKYLNTKFIISTILFIIALVMRFTIGAHWFMIILAVYVGTPILIQAFKNLRYGIIGIDLLVSIAVVGALLIGEYWEAAAVSYLFYFGAFLELAALSKTRGTIKSLIKAVPNRVNVLVDGEEVETDLDAVAVGSRVVVKPGTMIPIDGFVLEGFASVNEASITGESVAVEKELGKDVFAGTMIESGHLIIEVSKVGDDTAYAGIIRLIEDAQDQKTQTQKMIDAFSQVYTPIIIVLAVIAYFVTKDIRVALTLLVVSCPGALVIATPITIVSGIGSAAKSSVLIKSGQILEDLAKTDYFAFDKTGTLTMGEPVVYDIVEGTRKREEILLLAAIGERFSEHPIARAILAEVPGINVEGMDYEMIQGKGLSFYYEGEQLFLGNAKLFAHLDIPTVDPLGITVIVGNTEEIYGIILLRDAIRPSAKSVLQKLPGRKAMITGDHKGVADDIAARIGIDEVYADLLPVDKTTAIKEMQKTHKVAMVGDGINDAPALAQADIGISIGGASNTVAMETSDVILMDGKLETLPFAMSLAKQTIRIMKQNLVIAILTAVILILGVLGSKVSLSLGMLVHEITVLVVIANALRLLSKKG